MGVEAFKKFYLELAPLHNGLTFQMAVDFESSSDNHTFFQWLFPIDTKSSFNPDAPVINNEIIEFLSNNKLAHTNYLLAVSRYQEFLKNTPEWPARHNHNNLRVSRVLLSLRLSKNISTLYSFYKFVLSSLNEKKDELSVVNMDHWRYSAFGKVFFVYLTDNSNLSKVKDVVKQDYPDHQICIVESEEIEHFIELGESVLLDKHFNNIGFSLCDYLSLNRHWN